MAFGSYLISECDWLVFTLTDDCSFHQLVTGPLQSWSNAEGNICLLGDAAHRSVNAVLRQLLLRFADTNLHSMTNHMAQVSRVCVSTSVKLSTYHMNVRQGAATSMEDGAFLARCLRLVFQGQATVQDAVRIYEKGRMPKASYKQQVSYMNGWLWHLPDGPAQEARDKAMECELRGEVPMRSPNLYGDPSCVQECYGYDAEKHADCEIAAWLNGGQPVRDAATTITQDRADQMSWFLPDEHKFQVRPRL